MDTNNLSSLLYFNMISNKSDNTLLSILIIFILPILTNYLRQIDIKEIILNYINQKNKYITKIIPYHEYYIVRSMGATSISKIEYSDKFKAIQDYVKSLFFIELNSHEIITINKDMYKTYGMFENDNMNFDNKYDDILFTSTKTLIDKENLIYYELNNENNDDNDDNNKKDINKNKNKNKKFIITLSILKQSNINVSKVLDDFVEKLLKRYYEKINIEKNDNKLYIFTYLGSDKTDNNMDFHFEKNEHDPSIDLTKNVFFDGKDEYIKYLSDFIYDPNTKKSRGYEKFKEIGDKIQGSIIAYGPPGEGKTTIMKATPKFLGRHLIKYSLSQFKTNDEMEQFFSNTKICGVTYSRHQLCFCSEDIDAYNDNITMSRENNTISNKISNTISKLESNDQLESNDSLLITKALEETFKIVKIDDNKPNLQTFLNITDGIRELTGIFYMFSTNYFDKLDSALVRDGRIDVKLNLLPPSINIIKQIVQHRFNVSSNDIETYFENKNIKDNTISTATIIKICKKYNNDIIKCIDEIEKISNTIDNLANSNI